ncbi:MAG: 2-C-methyl-D-erythritol 2,4-cyclodiphosphate synthase [Actinomycetota bacterium]|jgi:2-C-methyl-D-erythritol 2,4-cyclodiphosphate synthase
MTEQRFGLGFDVHPFGVGRTLFLGGVRFDGEPGLTGHSDGDAVCHALADALLGAAALGDVGEHFREDDERLEGIAGLDLLSRTVAKVRVHGLAPWSADVTVVAERPPIAPHRDEMRRNLATTLNVPLERLSVKATRPEGLGLTGEGVGCLALAVLSPE